LQSINHDDFITFFPMWQMSPMPLAANVSDSKLIQNVTGILFTENSNSVSSSALHQVINRVGGVMTQFMYEDTGFSDLAYYDIPRTKSLLSDHVQRF
jgi:hypothetical protein